MEKTNEQIYCRKTYYLREKCLTKETIKDFTTAYCKYSNCQYYIDVTKLYKMNESGE